MDEDYYSVNADKPWPVDKPLPEKKRMPCYYKQEVADICLNCQKKHCISGIGCEEYRQAEGRAAKSRTNMKSIPQAVITVNGMTKTLKEWADQFGIHHITLYKRARFYGRTVEQEIEIRLREAGKWRSVALNGQMSRN